MRGWAAVCGEWETIQSCMEERRQRRGRERLGEAERGRERQREAGRGWERQREAGRGRERQREAGRGWERQREAERGKERQREAERGRERQREAERGRERMGEAERGRERQREAERGRERPGEDGRGRERLREAGRGRERQREAERGRERQGEAERGRERMGEAGAVVSRDELLLHNCSAANLVLFKLSNDFEATGGAADSIKAEQLFGRGVTPLRSSYSVILCWMLCGCSFKVVDRKCGHPADHGALLTLRLNDGRVDVSLFEGLDGLLLAAPIQPLVQPIPSESLVVPVKVDPLQDQAQPRSFGNVHLILPPAALDHFVLRVALCHRDHQADHLPDLVQHKALAPYACTFSFSAESSFSSLALFSSLAVCSSLDASLIVLNTSRGPPGETSQHNP
ncbi:Nipped-B-like protein B [Liparis tanakae]|uniref:Nipped-B-like protein B n=1 Tax=Liparis tanakae TaxID=230148 RepID=A0A4Z2I0J4_9TELE|nr:Nipped-B-like protein B [Liparis tanakae]